MNPELVLSVADLEKRFGNVLAVRNLDFDVRRGEVLGLIGPNGAGKTTTMRILTGFLSLTRGVVEVLGVDHQKEPLRAKQLIGYCPENVPVYPDLKVREYLSFRAKLKGVRARARRGRIAAVVEALDLSTVEKQLLVHLSKGYRQRVGLAAALLNDPPVLILDEPTIGLDPEQIRQFRVLIGQLKTHHSILISSHILAELEKVCDRVLILHEGRRIAFEEPSRLFDVEGGAEAVILEARGDAAAIQAGLENLESIESVVLEEIGGGDWTRFHIGVRGGSDAREAVGKVVHAAGGVVRELRTDRPDLEQIFHRLVGRERRSG